MKGTASSIVSQFIGKQNTIAIPTVLVRLTGDFTAAAFLAQCIYWSERSTSGDGWFYKTGAQWEEELFISPKQTRRAVEACRGTVLVSRRGIPAKNYYRVDMDAFLEALESLESNNKMCPKVTTGGDQRAQQVHDDRAHLYTEITSEITAEREDPPARPKKQEPTTSRHTDLPSQGEKNVAPVQPETTQANSAHSTVPDGEAAGPMFRRLIGPDFEKRFARDLDRWADQYSPAFITMVRDIIPSLHNPRGQFTMADLFNQDSRRPWPEALVKQYKADLKASQQAPEDRVPVLGEVLVCGPNSGRVLEVLHADRLVSIQTGDGPADYLTVPWASTQPAVRRSA